MEAARESHSRTTIFCWFAMAEEIFERPYITVGFSAYLILLALGLTSPRVMVRKLGKNWKRPKEYLTFECDMC